MNKNHFVMVTETLVVFEKTTREFLNLLKSLDEKAFNQKSSDGSWSPAQIGEHILKSYASAETLLGRTTSTQREPIEKIANIRKLFLDYSLRMKSPEAIIPTVQPINKARLCSQMEKRIMQLADVIKTADLSLTCIDYAIPEYGYFTRLEWIWFNIYHTRRHTFQLKNTIRNFQKQNTNEQQ